MSHCQERAPAPGPGPPPKGGGWGAGRPRSIDNRLTSWWLCQFIIYIWFMSSGIDYCFALSYWIDMIHWTWNHAQHLELRHKSEYSQYREYSEHSEVLCWPFDRVPKPEAQPCRVGPKNEVYRAQNTAKQKKRCSCSWFFNVIMGFLGFILFQNG